MIERPRFLDEPLDIGQHVNSSSEQESTVRLTNSPKFSKPVLLDHDPSGLEALPPIDAVEKISRFSSTVGTGTLVILAFGGLILSWMVLSTISFVIGEYRLEHLLGVAAGVFSGLCFSILAVVITREITSWRSLKEIDKLHAIISSPISEFELVSKASLEWIDLMSRSFDNPTAIKEIVKSSISADEIRSYLRSHVVKILDDAVDNCANQAILQVVAITAISPRVSWDGIVIVIRSIILVRQIARLFGVRPGVAATITIVRHVMITAAATSAAISVGGKLVDMLLRKTPFVGELAEAAGVGATEWTRIRGLAKLTAKICSPVR